MLIPNSGSAMSDAKPNLRFPLLNQVLIGETADVYFLRTRQVLTELRHDPEVGMEIFPGRAGVLCGVLQGLQLLDDAGFEGEIRAQIGRASCRESGWS